MFISIYIYLYIQIYEYEYIYKYMNINILTYINIERSVERSFWIRTMIFDHSIPRVLLLQRDNE